MNMLQPLAAGYYLLTITVDKRRNPYHRTVTSNSERAYIISVLQDTLKSHPAINDTYPTHKNLSVHIDLLAFSITQERIALVLFGLSRADIQHLSAVIINQLGDFRQDLQMQEVALQSRITHLSGPHNALQTTTLIHADHTDWEYDRYSSIGFYLHERRGGWMHLWRMTRLYNNPETYRLLMQSTIEIKNPTPAAS